MRTHTGCTCRAAHTSLLFCCTSPGVQGPPAHGIEPVRQWGNLLCKEGRNPETAQCSIPVLKGNTGVPSLDEILTLLHPGQEMPLVPSCPGSIFSDSCPFPAVQLCGVARIVTGIIKVTLLRQQSHCWVSACLSGHLPPIFLSWALLAWPAGIVRDPLAHVQRAGIAVFLLPDDFWLTLPAKHQANFLVPITIAVLYFSSWSISILQTNIVEMVEYPNPGLAECSVTCPCVCSEEWKQNIANISWAVSSPGQCHFVKETKMNVSNACKCCR